MCFKISLALAISLIASSFAVAANDQSVVCEISAGGHGSGIWSVDAHFSGGSLLGPVPKVIDTTEVVSAAPMSVYQIARTGSFTYTLSGLMPHSEYLVKLHFCENWYSAAGMRQFEVAINGNTVLSHFDVFAVAGGQYRAVAKTFSAIANAAGAIKVNFSGNAILSGIEVDADHGFVVSTGTNLSVAGTPFRPNGVDLGNWMVQEPYMMDTGDRPFLAISNGGVTNGSWLGDELYSGGSVLGPETNPVSTQGVSHPAPAEVYQRARTGAFDYAITDLAPNASYRVRLHFAENWVSGPGRRQFNVTINGTKVLSNFDVYAAAGGQNRAVIKQFDETADQNGAMTISFSQNAIVNGIELQSDQWTSMAKYFAKAAGGSANYNAWYTSWLNNYVTQGDIKWIAAHDFNTVRVPLTYSDFLDANSQFVNSGAYPKPLPAGAPRGLAYLDKLVKWCSAAGIYMMPDMHVYPRDCFVYSATTDNASLDQIKAAWQTIAARYSAQTCILGYDLLNEPPGYINDAQRPTALEVRNAIRKYDTNHVIVVESNVYSDLGNSTDWYLGTPIDSNETISVHFYLTKPRGYSISADAPNGRMYLTWLYCTTFNLPFVMGEFGENDNTNDNTVMEAWKQGHDGFVGGTIFWTFKKPESVRCILSTPSDSKWSAVTSYVSSGAYGSPPSGSFKTMTNEALDTNVSNALVRRDVLDSLIRSNYQATVPYVSLVTIPGRIDLVNYDLGAQGCAYQTPYGYPPFWAYRNDDVGTGVSSDSGGFGYCIGSNSVGDFERYTLNATPGVYDLRVRYAGYGGTIHVMVGGVNVSGPIRLPSTGGWYTWTTLSVKGVKVAASGSTTVELDCDAAGYNIEWLDFAATTTPSPVNAASAGSTTVPLSTAKESHLGATLESTHGHIIRAM